MNGICATYLEWNDQLVKCEPVHTQYLDGLRERLPGTVTREEYGRKHPKLRATQDLYRRGGGDCTRSVHHAPSTLLGIECVACSSYLARCVKCSHQRSLSEMTAPIQCSDWKLAFI